MALQKNGGTRLRGIPAPILIAVAVLWISAAFGLLESGSDWIDYLDRDGGNPFTAILLFGLTMADLVNACLGLAIQLHRHWARSTAIMLGLARTAVASIAIVAGDDPSYAAIAMNLVIVVLMLMPSAAAWCDR